MFVRLPQTAAMVMYFPTRSRVLVQYHFLNEIIAVRMIHWNYFECEPVINTNLPSSQFRYSFFQIQVFFPQIRFYLGSKFVLVLD